MKIPNSGSIKAKLVSLFGFPQYINKFNQLKFRLINKSHKKLMKRIICAADLPKISSNYSNHQPKIDYSAAEAYERDGDYEKALEQYKLLASNDSHAQYKCGEILFNHFDRKKMGKEIFAYFEQAANHNQSKPEAYAMLARLYLKGVGVKKDPTIAIKYCNKAIDCNLSAGYALLGKIYLRGISVQQSYEKAGQYFQQAIEMDGNADAQFQIVSFTKFFGEKNQGKAKEYLDKAAAQNNKYALHLLGKLHLDGIGRAKNIDQAVHFFKLAAHHGSTKSWYKLGQYFLTVPDNVEAARCFIKAADKGHADSLYQLATLHVLGKGVPQDKNQALHYFKEAADRGHVDGAYAFAKASQAAGDKDIAGILTYYIKAGQGNHDLAWIEIEKLAPQLKEHAKALGLDLFNFCLGMLHQKKKDLNNIKLGADYLKQAADQGHRYSAYLFGRLCQLGENGIYKDTQQAIKYLTQATTQNDEEEIISNAWSALAEICLEEKVKLDNFQAMHAYFLTSKRPDAHFFLGEFYYKGKGVEPNDDLAIKYYTSAAVRGNRLAMVQMGYMYLNGEGCEKKRDVAIKCYKKAVGANLTDAASKQASEALAELYLHEGNFSEAAKYCFIAIDAGSTQVASELGCIYSQTHQLTDTEFLKMKKYLQDMANHDANAGYWLGTFYRDTASRYRGFAKDIENAKFYLEKSSNLGCVQATNDLGLIWLDLGDTEKGLSYIKAAAESGDHDALQTFAANFGDKEARALTFKKPELKLCDDEISVELAHFLGKYFRFNTTTTSLKIDIGEHELLELAKGLRENTTLTSLEILGNSSDNSILNSLLVLFESGSILGLKKLTIDTTNASEDHEDLPTIESTIEIFNFLNHTPTELKIKIISYSYSAMHAEQFINAVKLSVEIRNKAWREIVYCLSLTYFPSDILTHLLLYVPYNSEIASNNLGC